MKVTIDGIPQIANVDDLNAALADIVSELGVDVTTAEHFLYLTLGISVVHPEDSAQHVFTALAPKAVDSKKGWETTWLTAMLRKSAEEHRPAYERALELGINPIPALQLITDMGPEAARETVNLLKAESEASQ